MKKFLYSVFMLAAVVLVFTACSNDETIETSGNGQNNKGMVLVATVSQQDSRATIDVDVNDTKGTWKFTFDDNDNVVVGNNTIDNYYTFTKNGDNFSCADAKPTASPSTQGGRIKMRSPPKVLTGNFRPSQLSFFLS